MLPQLRNFIQRDDDQVREYLEAIEGGAIEGPVVQKEGSKGSFGGSLRGGISLAGAGIEGKKGTEASSEAHVVRTPAADFQRLYEYLERDKHIDRLEECDDDHLEAVTHGQVVEAYVVGRLSRRDQQLLQLQQASAQMREGMRLASEIKGMVEPLLEAASSFGVDLTSDDPEFANTVEQVNRFRAPTFPTIDSPQKIAVVGTLLGYSRSALAIAIRTGTLQKEADELNGEYTVLGKLIRKVARGSTCDASEFSSLPLSLSRAKRRKAKASDPDPINGPALVIEPIAMYR